MRNRSSDSAPHDVGPLRRRRARGQRRRAGRAGADPAAHHVERDAADDQERRGGRDRQPEGDGGGQHEGDQRQHPGDEQRQEQQPGQDPARHGPWPAPADAADLRLPGAADGRRRTRGRRGRWCAGCVPRLLGTRTNVRFARVRSGAPGYGSRAGSRTRGVARVPQGAGRQPRRDRDPRVPGRLRARGVDRRGLPLRGPQLAAPGEGRRVVPDRRARPPRARLPVGRRGDQGRAQGRRRRDLPRLRVPVGEPGPRRRPATTPGSRSSARRRRCCT